MPTKMLDARSLEEMSGSALVAHYNQLVEENPELGYKPTARFATAAKGIYRIEALYSSIKGAAADDGRVHPTKSAPGDGIPAAQRSKNSNPGSLARFTAAYDAAGSQEAQDQLHEDQFLDEPASSGEATDAEEQDMAKKSAKKTARKGRTTAKATGSTARGFAPEAKITILAEENPRRGAAAERFKLYKNGMTVATYCEKFEGGRSEALVHLRWDVKHGFIKVA